MLAGVLASQSTEGWFPEYDGADPGYQTLCLDYLTACAAYAPSPAFERALERSVGFLQWFAHPDGSFGGVYGSRRTSLVYLGGLARLAARSPLARALLLHAAEAMTTGAGISPATVDMGNLAPLLTSTGSATDAVSSEGDLAVLPCHRDDEPSVDFADAGLSVRATRALYLVCGTANGGTVTVYDRAHRRCLMDDGGYVARLADGSLLTTQSTGAGRTTSGAAQIEVRTAFRRMPAERPTPFRFFVLRALNLTVMRHVGIGNAVKRALVRLLMGGGAAHSMTLTRRITWSHEGVLIDDELGNPDGVLLSSLTCGVPFSAIHMASAGYSTPAQIRRERDVAAVDVERLARERVVRMQRRVA